MTGRYRHVVLFRLHDGTSDADVETALAVLRRAGDAPGVVEWTVELSDDRRKGVVIVENGLFEDREAFERWRAHPLHRAATEHLAGVADWWVGDYPER